MVQRLWIGVALTATGCLGLDWGGQSGAETTNVHLCEEVSRDAVDGVESTAKGMDFSVADFLERHEGPWDGQLTTDVDNYPLTAHLMLDGTPHVIDRATVSEGCPRAYTVPLTLTLSGEGPIGAVFSFEVVADKVDAFYTPTLALAGDVQTDLQGPWPDAQVLVYGEFLSGTASGAIQWVADDRTQLLGEWELERE